MYNIDSVSNIFTKYMNCYVLDTNYILQEEPSLIAKKAYIIAWFR